MSEAILNILFVSIVIGILTFIKLGLDYIRLKSNDSKFVEIITIIQAAVDEVSQKYVESLKANKEFNEDAQNEALRKAINTSISNMSDDMKSYIRDHSEDIEIWITTQIESYIYKNKRDKSSTIQRLNG